MEKSETYLSTTRKDLAEIVNKSGLESCNKKDFNNLSQLPTKDLTFQNSLHLWQLSYQEKSRFYQEQRALERMYALCSNAILAEAILANLTFIYVINKKYSVAAETLHYFNRLFPGSQWHNIMRLLHVEVLFQLCKSHEYDQENINVTLAHCQWFVKDYNEGKLEKNDEALEMVIHIACALFKELMIYHSKTAQFYIKRYFYTRDPVCIYASMQRMNEINTVINDAQDVYKIIKEEKHEKECSLCSSFSVLVDTTTRLINNFFSVHKIVMPHGKDYIEQYNVLLNSIACNTTCYKNDLKDILKNINKCL